MILLSKKKIKKTRKFKSKAIRESYSVQKNPSKISWRDKKKLQH
jgi:hypothetical protein